MSLPFVFHQKLEEHNKKIKKNGNTQKINSILFVFDKWSYIWWPLATWDRVTSYQSSYVSVLANILDFFNRKSELCNHSDSSPLMTLQVGQWSPWQPPVAWEERWLERKNQCRSAQMRQSCQILVWSSFTISLVGAHGYGQKADLRTPLKGKWGWHHRWWCEWATRVKIKVFLRSTGQMFLSVFTLWFWRWASLKWLLVLKFQEENKRSLFKHLQGSQTSKMDPRVTLDPVLCGRGPSHLSLLMNGYSVGWHSSLASIHHQTQNP